MSEMLHSTKLTEIEKGLRKPENDLEYLRVQLLILSALLYNFTKDGKEDGLVSAIVGGMDHYLDRLRGLLKDTRGELKSRDEMREVFAKVEIMRYACSAPEIQATLDHYRKANLLVNQHTLKMSDGSTVTAFTSRLDQTTLDGKKITQGELMEANHAPVISFWNLYNQLPENEKALK